LWIAYQDFKQRAVSIVLFIVLALLLLGLNLSIGPWKEKYPQMLANILFLAFQFSVILIYFRVKTGRWGHVMDQKLGWGDIAFLCCLTLNMPFLSFFLFYAVSLFLVLLITLIRKDWRDPEKGVPLAGCQALLFVGYFMVERTGYINWEQTFQQVLS
jgi:drug/metabolite transporter (DMT)-like permease